MYASLRHALNVQSSSQTHMLNNDMLVVWMNKAWFHHFRSWAVLVWIQVLPAVSCLTLDKLWISLGLISYVSKIGQLYYLLHIHITGLEQWKTNGKPPILSYILIIFLSWYYYHYFPPLHLQSLSKDVLTTVVKEKASGIMKSGLTCWLHHVPV